MIPRICLQQSISAGLPTPVLWSEIELAMKQPHVQNICDQIQLLDRNNHDELSRLKRQLPVITPHACRFDNDGTRKSTNAIPSGLVMLDIDHIENPRDFFSTHIFPVLSNSEAVQQRSGLTSDSEAIYFVAITPSGHGLRIIAERQENESLIAAQTRLANLCGFAEYDAVTHDLARASFLMPWSYVLYCEPSGLNFDTPEQEAMTTAHFAQMEKPLPLGCVVPQRNVVENNVVDVVVHSDPCRGRDIDCRETLSPLSSTTTYRGLPYEDIVSQLLVSIGNCGGAEIGERNTVYFTLASYMRYICDFNPDLLLRVLPDFGLSVQERRQVISSAIGRPRKAQIPLTLQSALAICEREQEANSLPFREGLGLGCKSTDLPLPELPRLLRLICKRLPADYQPAMIIAALPVLGTLATRIRFEYLDRQEHSLSFFSCITAPAASGKSFIRKPLDLLLTPINEQDAIEREKEQAYKEKMRASKNSKNQPEDPHACPRNNGVAISIAKLLQLLTYAEGKHLIGIGEEMDTLVKSERAGVWSQKSDIYRLAFDNAEYGQAYMSDTSFNAHIRVYYNLLLTGTPNSMKRFFKDLENGLATRVCFAQLPDTSFTEIPVFAPYSAADKAEIIRWARQLDAEDGTISCPKVGSVIADWLERKRQQAIDADSHAMDTLRRRAAVIGFRAGMLCFLLENRKYTKIVGDFAEWVAEYVFRNQMELWGEQMELELSGALELISGERGSAASLLALLPQEFTAADLIKLRAKKGQSVKTSAISMVLNRWRTNHRIEKINESTWRKL